MIWIREAFSVRDTVRYALLSVQKYRRMTQQENRSNGKLCAKVEVFRLFQLPPHQEQVGGTTKATKEVVSAVASRPLVPS